MRGSSYPSDCLKPQEWQELGRARESPATATDWPWVAGVADPKMVGRFAGCCAFRQRQSPTTRTSSPWRAEQIRDIRVRLRSTCSTS